MDLGIAGRKALVCAASRGLTGFVAGLARKVARDNVTINNLLPGFFDTDQNVLIDGGAYPGTF